MAVGVLFFSLSLMGQIPSTDSNAYERARQEVVVLQDPGGILPLQRLDTLRPAYARIGFAQDETLWATLNAYQPFSKLVPGRSQPAWIHPLPGWDDQSINLFVLAMDAEGLFNADAPFGQLFTPSASQSILLVFGENELVEQLLESFPGAIVWAPENTPWMQSIAAQIIFGGQGTTARTSRDIGPQFPQGSGLRIKPILRLAYAPPAAQKMDAQLLHDSITAIVNDGIVHGAFPGAQVLVAREGTVIYHEAFGYHSDTEIRPVKRTDIYDLASVSKISTALPALMKAYGEGRFDLDAPLKQYDPDFRRSNKADLTFRSMLAHNARLRPWIPYWQGTLRGHAKYPWRKRWDSSRTNDYHFRCKTFARDSSAKYPIYVTDDLWQHRHYRAKMMRAIRKSPLNEEGGYRYSGLLFYLLPDIVADLNNADYESYLKTTFYHPLGAYTMTYNPLRFFPRERIIPTERDTFFRMTQLHGYVHDEGAAMMGGVSANAGLFASANDLAKLMQLYLYGGAYGGEQLIPAEAVAEFTRCQYCDEGNRRGLGFDKPLIEYDPASSSVAKAASPRSFGHSGYTGTFTWADPESGVLFIFMSNRVYPTRANRGIYTRNIRPRIHTAIYQAME